MKPNNRLYFVQIARPLELPEDVPSAIFSPLSPCHHRRHRQTHIHNWRTHLRCCQLLNALANSYNIKNFYYLGLIINKQSINKNNSKLFRLFYKDCVKAYLIIINNKIIGIATRLP